MPREKDDAWARAAPLNPHPEGRAKPGVSKDEARRWPFMVRDALRAPHHEGAGSLPRWLEPRGIAPRLPPIPSTGRTVSDDPVSLVQ